MLLSIGRPRLLRQQKGGEGLGQVGGSGKSSPSQSHEPGSNVAAAVAAGRSAVCACKRRTGEAHRDSGMGEEEVGGSEGEGGEYGGGEELD